MPIINPSQVPTIAPGRLFSRFTSDSTFNIRWLQPTDAVYFETLNRPIVDEAVRTLVLAKSVDTLYGSLGQQALFPFLVQPRVGSGTDQTDVPINWIWGLNLSLPKKWENVRLSKIKRVSGANDLTGGYSGYLRLVFSASQVGQVAETSIFQVDYQIDSTLTYQVLSLGVVDGADESNAISPDEVETVAGRITFRTLSGADLVSAAFLELVAPPANVTDSNGDDIYDSPSVYEVVDTVGGGTATDGDYSIAPITHGTGLITEAAWTSIPHLDSDAQSWLNAFNYPFDSAASRISADGIRLPQGLFREFTITVPAGDEPTGSSDPTYFPVWISRVQLVASSQARLFFATHNTTETATGGQPSLAAVEFATLDLFKNGSPGDRAAITPMGDLRLGGTADFGQHFGRGHVVLSSLWGSSNNQEILDFFNDMASILASPQDTLFSAGSTRVGSFGVSSVPKYTPTYGQSKALTGSTSRLATPVHPSETNRYVTEADQGLGNTVDLESITGITPNAAMERYGYTGGLNHRIVKMVQKSASVGTDPDFYVNVVKPRLEVLFGRPMVFGDLWYNGVVLSLWNGDTWQTL